MCVRVCVRASVCASVSVLLLLLQDLSPVFLFCHSQIPVDFLFPLVYGGETTNGARRMSEEDDLDLGTRVQSEVARFLDLYGSCLWGPMIVVDADLDVLCFIVVATLLLFSSPCPMAPISTRRTSRRS